MSKRCAREECGKAVYPIEELKCLDKVWHKLCFKCTVCGMILNMKNYKGYDKKPYCEPHYPKTVASVVADTPEMRRIAENTRIQSNIQYHAEYEKMRGTKIEIADDPEMERLKKNTQVQSNISYHGDLDKKKKQEELRPTEVEASSEVAPTGNLHGFAAAQSTATEFKSNAGAPQKSIGRIADYDPLSELKEKQKNNNEGINQLKSQVDQGPPKFCADFAKNGKSANGAQVPKVAVAAANSGKSGFVVKAVYDYSAADKDEVSFVEGDVIVNCQKVDEGWMTGTVQRTLQWGMLPANYVEPFKSTTGLHRLS